MKINIIVLVALLGALTQSKIVKVVEYARHGARQPIELFDFAKNPEEEFTHSGRLTALGLRQHYMIGQEIRHRYVDTETVVPKGYN
jgi:hypothetical protein